MNQTDSFTYQQSPLKIRCPDVKELPLNGNCLIITVSFETFINFI